MRWSKGVDRFLAKLGARMVWPAAAGTYAEGIRVRTVVSALADAGFAASGLVPAVSVDVLLERVACLGGADLAWSGDRWTHGGAA